MDFEAVYKKVLICSIIFTTAFAIIALTVGFLTSSQVILVDGTLNLLGAALTLPSIAAMKFIEKKDSFNYPFGKETFEPFVAIVQYCIILYICITIIINAVQVILSGGNIVHMGYGILYGVFFTILNFIVYSYLKILTKKHSTTIADVEVDNWKFSLLFSCGVFLGFGISWMLSMLDLVVHIPFVDPIMTILITLIFIQTPIVAMRNCVKELLQARPSEEIISLINEKVKEVDKNYDFIDNVIRIGKVGGKIIIEIDYIIEKHSTLDSIIVQDQLRKELINILVKMPYEKWINLNFTNNVNLTEHYLKT